MLKILTLLAVLCFIGPAYSLADSPQKNSIVIVDWVCDRYINQQLENCYKQPYQGHSVQVQLLELKGPITNSVVVITIQAPGQNPKIEQFNISGTVWSVQVRGTIQAPWGTKGYPAYAILSMK